MNGDFRDKLNELGLRVIAFLRDWPTRWARIRDQIRQDPRDLWELAEVRTLAACVGGVVVVGGLILAMASLATPSDPGVEASAAIKVVFRARCAEPSCGHRWDFTDRADFDDWPVPCPVCGRKSGRRLVRCPAAQCGKWVIPLEAPDGARRCPDCGATW